MFVDNMMVGALHAGRCRGMIVVFVFMIVKF